MEKSSPSRGRSFLDFLRGHHRLPSGLARLPGMMVNRHLAEIPDVAERFRLDDPPLDEGGKGVIEKRLAEYQADFGVFPDRLLPEYFRDVLAQMNTEM